jgi:hypothetical protein
MALEDICPRKIFEEEGGVRLTVLLNISAFLIHDNNFSHILLLTFCNSVSVSSNIF